MVLVSFVLVVVAAIALVIGLLQSGLGIIYVSIACSVAAGVVLVVAVLRGRPEARPGAAPAPGPAPQSAPPPAPPEAETTRVSAAPPPPPPPPSEPEREPAMAGAGRGGAGTAVASDRTEQLQQVEIEEAVATDDGFPIHDYEKLRATEILPMLAELDEDQLQAVRRREQAGKNRFMILSRIDDELQAREGEGWDADDEGWAEDEPTAAPPPEAAAEPEPEPEPAPVAGAVLVGPAGDGAFPIPDYDNLRALEILGRLSDLSSDELQAVRRREEGGARRAMILNRIDRLLEDAEPSAEPREPVGVSGGARPETPVRRSRARATAPGGRTAKAPATKRAASAKKAEAAAPRSTKRTAKEPRPAAKAPGRAAAAKAPATKARAAKAPVGKAPATKAPGRRAAKAPAAKSAATKSSATRAPAKKSALPTKKATKRR